MGRRIYILLTLCICNVYLYSQTISGYVRDSLSNESLVGAYIYTLDNQAVCISNEYGFFSLQLAPEHTLPIDVYVSYIGYNEQKITITSTSQDFYTIHLSPSNVIQTVVVEHKKEQTDVLGKIDLPMKQLQTLPSLGGEVNILRAMQLLPGVGAGSEGKSDLYVRGGSPDQNLILLDDVPLYYVNHLGGFASVFDANAISGFSFYKGSFPAKYGSRLSSVIDVRMKNGNMKKRETNVMLGVLSSKVSTEGPIKIDTSSYMISVRRSLYDVIMRPAARLSGINSNAKITAYYYFYDVYTKYNHILSDKDRVYISFFSGYDKTSFKFKEKGIGIKNEEEMLTKWGNLMTAGRWNHAFNQKMFGNFTVYFTRYQYKDQYKSYSNINSLEQRDENKFLNQIQDVSAKTDFDLYYPDFHIRFGSQHTYHTFLPNYGSHFHSGDYDIDTSFNDIRTTSFENNLYIDNTVKIYDISEFRFGLRGTYYNVNGNLYNSVEPRILFNMKLEDICDIKAYWGQSFQYIHFLRSPDLFYTRESWMPANEVAKPEKSEILSVGLSRPIEKLGLQFSIEGYTKKMTNLISYEENEDFFSTTGRSWVDFVETEGKGFSKGLEFFLQKKEGIVNGWISYTLSNTTRKFAGINNGEEYLYDFDAKHNLAIVMNYEFSEHLVFSATWVYTTGRAITIVNDRYLYAVIDPNEPNGVRLVEGGKASEKNNVRTAPYHRLDLSITHTVMKKDKERVWSFGLYNAYNRQNAFLYQIETPDNFYYTDVDPYLVENTNLKLFEVSLFQIIPSVSYSMKF